MRINIKSIRKGDHFWGRGKEFMATEDATSIEVEFFGKMVGQHSVYGAPVNKTSDNQEVVRFMETEGAEHYGPKLQSENVYKDIDLFPDTRVAAEVKFYPSEKIKEFAAMLKGC